MIGTKKVEFSFLQPSVEMLIKHEASLSKIIFELFKEFAEKCFNVFARLESIHTCELLQFTKQIVIA